MNKSIASVALNIPNVNIQFSTISNCKNDAQRLELLNKVLKHHLTILTALINIDCVNSFKEKEHPEDLEKITLGNFDYDHNRQWFECSVMLNDCEYFQLSYCANDRMWELYEQWMQLGDRDTPPTEDYVDLAASKDFNVILESIIQQYHKYIAQNISDNREAEEYEDNVKFAEELYHMQYGK
jgi:hypothetical protein